MQPRAEGYARLLQRSGAKRWIIIKACAFHCPGHVGEEIESGVRFETSDAVDGIEHRHGHVAPLLQCLNDMKKLNSERQLALASYISFPRSTDVVNVLRVAICPHQPPDCDRHCPPGKARDCEAVAGVRDRELFLNLLESGERSALFISPSKIVKGHYGEHRIYFFYVRLADEIARIEIPQWVAENQGLLNLTHSLVLDQCRRGHGYPVVLSEAHEQAVVTGIDRENFWELVESSMVAEKMPSPTSAKSFSKRTRWV